jgi:hypothetical protein
MPRRKLTKASECNCCVCGKPAVAFWPIIEPDIPANPYCRECLDKAKKELLIKLFEDEHSSRNDKGRD